MFQMLENIDNFKCVVAFVSEKTLPQAFSIVENVQQLKAIYMLFASFCFYLLLLLFASICFILLQFATICFFMLFLNFESFLSFREILYAPR
jgi:hypothetical protein